MLYWVIAFSWAIVGTIIFWIVLSSKWSKKDPLYEHMLDTIRVLHPNIPGFPGYLDLKFSVLRHAIAFLISAVIIFFVEYRWILTTILFLNLLYAYSSIARYRSRKNYINEVTAGRKESPIKEYLILPVKDSFCTVIHSVVSSLLLYVLFALRP